MLVVLAAALRLVVLKLRSFLARGGLVLASSKLIESCYNKAVRSESDTRLSGNENERRSHSGSQGRRQASGGQGGKRRES